MCDADRRKATDNLPPGITETYYQILGRLSGRKLEIVTNALKWLICCTRPLSVKELNVAIAIDITDDQFQPERMLDQEETILELLCSLVKVDPAGNIEFAHFSVAEYLTSRRMPDDSPNPHYIDRQEDNITLLQCCIFYLSHLRVEPVSSHKVPASPEYELLDYASLQWPLHARAAEGQAYDLGPIMSFLTPQGGSFKRWSEMWEAQFPLAWRCPQNFRDGRLYVVLFGLVQVAKALLEIPELSLTSSNELEKKWLTNTHESVEELDKVKDFVNDRKDVSLWIQKGYKSMHSWLIAGFFGDASSVAGFVEVSLCISEDIATQVSLEWPWSLIAGVIKFGMLQTSALILLADEQAR